MSRKSSGESINAASGCTLALLGPFAIAFSLYFTHEILAFVNADERLWTFYWIYVAVSVISVVFRVVKEVIDNLD